MVVGNGVVVVGDVVVVVVVVAFTVVIVVVSIFSEVAWLVGFLGGSVDVGGSDDDVYRGFERRDTSLVISAFVVIEKEDEASLVSMFGL